MRVYRRSFVTVPVPRAWVPVCWSKDDEGRCKGAHSAVLTCTLCAVCPFFQGPVDA